MQFNISVIASLQPASPNQEVSELQCNFFVTKAMEKYVQLYIDRRLG